MVCVRVFSGVSCKRLYRRIHAKKEGRGDIVGEEEIINIARLELCMNGRKLFCRISGQDVSDPRSDPCSLLGATSQPRSRIAPLRNPVCICGTNISRSVSGVDKVYTLNGLDCAGQ